MRLSRGFFHLLLIVMSAAGCQQSERGDEVVIVEEKDAEMNAAIASARSMLPEFWQHVEHPGPGESGFSLKVKISDGDQHEHFWVGSLERKEGKTFGTIDNDPQSVHTVKLGQRIEIPEQDISDWTFLRNGKIVGNRTVRALFNTMPKEKAENLRKMMEEM